MTHHSPGQLHQMRSRHGTVVRKSSIEMETRARRVTRPRSIMVHVDVHRLVSVCDGRGPLETVDSERVDEPGDPSRGFGRNTVFPTAAADQERNTK